MKKNYFFTLLVSMIFCALSANAQDTPEITTTFSPENGATVNELSSFDITFSVPMIIDSPGDVVIKCDGAQVNASVDCVLSNDNKTVTFNLTPTLTTPGVYTFENLDWAVWPERFEDGACPFIDLSYTIGSASSDALTWEITPANESQLEEISTFKVVFDKDVIVDWPESIEVYKNGERLYDVSVALSVGADNKTCTYTLNKKLTEDGTYSIRNVNWSVWCPELDAELPEIEITYYIGEPQELEPVVTTSPSTDRNLSKLDEITLMFENVKTIEINSDKAVYLTDGKDKWPYHLTLEPGSKAVNAKPVDENFTATKGGKYTLVIENGALVLNGKDYGYEIVFTIVEQLALVSSDPAEGEVTATQLEHITLTWNQEIVSLTGYMMKNLKLSLLDEEGTPIEEVGYYTASIDATDAHIVHCDADYLDIYADGEYSFNLPPTLFKTSSDSNLAQVLAFYIGTSSIISAINENEQVNAYSVGGVKVIDGGNREDIRSLAPGMYIINGKTTLIR